MRLVDAWVCGGVSETPRPTVRDATEVAAAEGGAAFKLGDRMRPCFVNDPRPPAQPARRAATRASWWASAFGFDRA